MTSPDLVDTHCHLVLLEERGLLHQALEGAQAAGVTRIVTVGVNLDDNVRNMKLAEAYDTVWFTVGWDPQQRAAPDRAERAALAELVRHPRAVAVGEVGIDLNFRPGYHETPLEVQRQSFRIMLELAAEHGTPVVVHDRDAHDEVFAAVAEVPGSHGLMHCFTGDAAHARRCAGAGFLPSFAGIVTFRNAQAIQEAARQVPEDGFVVETDAPFLAPAPHRGSVNLPERVAVTAAMIAQLRDVGPDVVRRQTTMNALRVLGFGA